MERDVVGTKTIGDFGAKTVAGIRKERPLGNLYAEGRSNPRLYKGPKLAIAEDAFRDHAVLQLIDQCIVPALVDLFLRDQLTLPDATGRAHNVDLP